MPLKKSQKAAAARKKYAANLILKSAIVLSNRTQARIARAARMDETRLSHIVRGRLMPTPAERERLAAILAKPAADLFSGGAA